MGPPPHRPSEIGVTVKIVLDWHNDLETQVIVYVRELVSFFFSFLNPGLNESFPWPNMQLIISVWPLRELK